MSKTIRKQSTVEKDNYGMKTMRKQERRKLRQTEKKYLRRVKSSGYYTAGDKPDN